VLAFLLAVPFGVSAVFSRRWWIRLLLVLPILALAAHDAQKRPFAEFLPRTIAAGGDTDTIASIAGQIAGAALGLSALPSELVARLRYREEIVGIAERFGRMVCEIRGHG
jgi:ADP-ribosylglycohydrolase